MVHGGGDDDETVGVVVIVVVVSFAVVVGCGDVGTRAVLPVFVVIVILVDMFIACDAVVELVVI